MRIKKYCPENERVKRAYVLFLEAANGKQTATTDGVLRSIARFEEATGFREFRKFHVEQARSFRARLIDEKNAKGQPLSAATITTTLKHLREFFVWLSREPGFRKSIRTNDAAYFSPSEQDMRIASARHEKTPPAIEEIKHVLSLMPDGTSIEKRDRALIAFALMSGARDGALASFRLKHVDLARGIVLHDGRDVRTKGRKTFQSFFFPVGPEPLAIFSDYLAMLRTEWGFGPDDPLFPATQLGHGADRGFVAQGLSRALWTTAAPIRAIFRKAFTAAGLAYANPHLLRRTLVLMGESQCRTPEEWKAWSQNLGHESEATTFVGYGKLTTHRQGEIIAGLSKPRAGANIDGLDLAGLRAFLNSAEGPVAE